MIINSVALILKKNSYLLFSIVLLNIGCQNKSLETFEINNPLLNKELENFISALKKKNTLKEKFIIIEYQYTTERDTIIKVMNARPYTCKDVKGVKSYKGYQVFLFSNLSSATIKKDFNIKKPFTDCYKFVDNRYIDITFEINFRVKNGRAVERI